MKRVLIILTGFALIVFLVMTDWSNRSMEVTEQHAFEQQFET